MWAREAWTIIGEMLARFLFDPEGRVRVRHMIVVVGACTCCALFGSLLLVLTPVIGGGNEGRETLWVLFSIFVLKFPLVSLGFWFIMRNVESPMRPPKWSDRETGEILRYLVAESQRVQGLPDARSRLAYLQREAWNVADRVGGDAKVDAVDVALQIDSLLSPGGARRRSGQP